MKRLGLALTVVGAAAAIAGPFLHYAASESLWHLTTRYPAIFTALAASVVVLGLIGTATDLWFAPMLGAALAAFTLGEAFPAAADTYRYYEVGFWLLVGGSAVMVIGSLMNAAGSLRAARVRLEARTRLEQAAMADRIEAPPGGGRFERAAPTVVRERAPIAPPAGWYPDPADPDSERYWSGAEWTARVRTAARAG